MDESYEVADRGPEVHIHQDIDFYIIKEDMHRKREKARHHETAAVVAEKKDGNYELLRQENQFLKEKLNLVLKELEVYRKTVAANSPEIKIKTDRHRPSNITGLSVNSRLGLQNIDMLDVRKSLSKTYSGKQPVASASKPQSRTRLTNSKNLTKNSSIINSTGYLCLEKSYLAGIPRRSSRSEVDPLANFLSTLDKHKALMPKKSIKESNRREFSPDIKNLNPGIGKVISALHQKKHSEAILTSLAHSKKNKSTILVQQKLASAVQSGFVSPSSKKPLTTNNKPSRLLQIMKQACLQSKKMSKSTVHPESSNTSKPLPNGYLNI